MNKSGSHRGWSKFVQLAACVTMVGVLASCARPDSMQVREGDSPHYEDKDVAFRTTYYFRVFDYCAGTDSSKAAYARVPRIDSLYRFRMTGKADTIGKRIKFESGTLKSYQIDPFGASVVYDKHTGKFRFVSRQEADQRAKREAAFADFERLLDRYRRLAQENDAYRREAMKTAIEAAVASAATQMEGTGSPEEREEGLTAIIAKAITEGTKVSEGVPTATINLLQAALNDQLQRFAEINPDALDSVQRPPTGSERKRLEPRLEALRESARILQKRADTATREAETAITDASNRVQAREDQGAREAAKAQLRDALEQDAMANALLARAKEESEEAASLERRLRGVAVDQAAADADLICPGSLTRRRGFQILGPEGWRTFDQDDRLLMAMSSDASPIIGVLEDLSSRVLNARSRNQALLLPLAQERLRTVEAQRTLEQTPSGTSAEEVIRTVLEAFNQPAGAEE